jgi:hypothetical protein
MKHLTADPDLSGVPHPYRAIIQRALQKDPEKRFHNAADMVASLTPPTAPAAGTKPGPGAPVGQASRLPSDDPLYIGDEMEGIEFGPLEEHPERAVLGDVVRTSDNAAALTPMTDEPIAKAVRHGLGGFAHWWNHGPMNTPLKVAVLVAAAVLAIYHSSWLIPTSVVLGSVYLVYLGLRLLMHSSSNPTAAHVVATVDRPLNHMPRSPANGGLTWEQQGRMLLCEKTAGDTVGELTGSMVAAALISGILTLVMSAIGGDAIGKSADPLAGPMWLWLMTTVGTWSVLGAGKWCERSSGEMVKRRFAMLALGLAVGAIAFATSQYLMVNLGNGAAVGRGMPASHLIHDMYDSSGAPKLPAFLAYFGALFLTIGWWKQCDPLRSARLRIAPILLTVLAAWIWQLVLPFPQPWGFMLVGSIAIATQLSAPWLSTAQRTAAIARRQNGVA